MEFAAASGWAFSFGYKYDDVSAAHLAVRGNPELDGPSEVFAFLPRLFGFEYEMARARDHEELWRFVVKYVEAGTPIMCEHLDGGLITGHQEHDGRRQLYFDGTVAPGWIDIDKLQPHAVYVLKRKRDASPRDEITRRALTRAAAKGSAHRWGGIPQGMAALQAYLADVQDASKCFDETEEWFCWAAFERLMARRCGEVWLRSTAGQLTDRADELTLVAAERYGKAFERYERYLSEVSAGAQSAKSLRDRARTPRRIAVIAPLLEEAVAAEGEGLVALEQAIQA